VRAEATPASWLGRRYLLRVQGLHIPSYSAMLYLGCVIGTFSGAAVAGSGGLSESDFVFASVVLLVPALVGARLWFVFQHLDVFRAQPRRIWRRSEGGSALYGGVVLSVVVSAPVLEYFKLPFWAFWDAGSVTMLVGLIVTRVGCLLNGCCAGRPTNGRIGIWLPNAQGEWLRRIPTQVLEAVWAAVVVAIALAARSRLPFDGALLAVIAGGYAAGRLLLEPTRESVHPGRKMTANMLFSATLVAAAAAVLVVGWWFT